MTDDSPGEAATQELSLPKYLAPKEVQHELRIGQRLTYKLLKEGAIPSVRVGELYRIPRRQLEETLLADPRPFSAKGPPRTLTQR